MAYTARDASKAALREINVLSQGETMDADHIAACLEALNNLVDHWRAESLHLYALAETTWNIVSGTQTYAVGTGSAINVERPTYVDMVRFRDTSLTTPVEFNLYSKTDQDWERTPIKTLQSTLPTHYYYNPTFPTGTLKLWPIPTRTLLQGVLYARYGVTEFTDLDTAISLPPGYRRAIVKNLALELAPSYSKEPSPDLRAQAFDSAATVKRKNIRQVDMSFEPGSLGSITGRPYYIRTGE